MYGYTVNNKAKSPVKPSKYFPCAKRLLGGQYKEQRPHPNYKQCDAGVSSPSDGRAVSNILSQYRKRVLVAVAKPRICPRLIHINASCNPQTCRMNFCHFISTLCNLVSVSITCVAQAILALFRLFHVHFLCTV